MDTCKIFVVAHKKFEVPKNELFIPIQVGPADDLKLNRGLRDNNGDNIAKKNSSFCELTALYWIWKNIKDMKYVGLCHYRRYFANNSWNNKESNFINEQQILDILKTYDVIAPEEMTITKNVASFYYVQGAGRKKDLDNLVDIIHNKYPEYKSSLQQVLSSSKAYYCNMAIMSKDKWDVYCEWLFDILFELEKMTDLTGYTAAEQRIYGYLSEIMLNVWIKHNNLSVKNVPVVNTELKVSEYLKLNLKMFLRKIVNNFIS